MFTWFNSQKHITQSTSPSVAVYDVDLRGRNCEEIPVLGHSDQG